MDEAGRVESNNSNDRKGFYTVSEAAKVLGVGQRRILEMLETNELEGERDPISSRWKIAKHAADEFASEEPSDTTHHYSLKSPRTRRKRLASCWFLRRRRLLRKRHKLRSRCLLIGCPEKIRQKSPQNGPQRSFGNA